MRGVDVRPYKGLESEQLGAGLVDGLESTSGLLSESRSGGEGSLRELSADTKEVRIPKLEKQQNTQGELPGTGSIPALL